MHNLYPHDRRYRLLDHLCRLALCLLCHAVIVHCAYAKSLVAKHFGRKKGVYLIPHGHFIGVYPSEISRKQARQELGIPESHFVYLFFGSIQPYKGIGVLVEAFSTLEGADLNLVLTGAIVMPYAQTISAAAQKDKRIVLRLAERISSEDLQIYFNAADVVVFPFTAMLTSGSVILAMSCKKPVIVPTLGCLPELVTVDAGILYDPGDRGGLRKAMEEIRGRGLQDMGQKAYQRVMNFGWEKIAVLTLEVYKKK
jgi:glycosyltransferase involved in cell wall biosynthesis